MLAFVLAPLVELGEARGLPRLLAVAFVYLALAMIMFLAGALLWRPFVLQAALLAENMPSYITAVQVQLSGLTLWLESLGLGAGLAALEAESTRFATTEGRAFLGDLVRLITHLATSVFDTLLVLVVSFYLLLDGPRLLRAAAALVPARHQDKWRFVEESLVRVVGGYLRGQLVMGGSLGIIVWAGLTLLGVPYALVLGVLAAVLELVPMFGPILSALPALAVALFQPFPQFLWVLIFFVIVQQIEAHVLAPRITGHAVGLHPLGAIFALLVGLELGGPLGAIFAVPVAGFVWVIVATVYRRTLGIEEPRPRPGWRWPGRRWRITPPPRHVETRPANEPEQP